MLTKRECISLSSYNDFVNSLQNDFEQLLIAKGLTIKGAFKDCDEMVFGDKKNSDLAMEIEIELKETDGLRSKFSGLGSLQLLQVITSFIYKVIKNIIIDPQTGISSRKIG